MAQLSLHQVCCARGFAEVQLPHQACVTEQTSGLLRLIKKKNEKKTFFSFLGAVADADAAAAAAAAAAAVR